MTADPSSARLEGAAASIAANRTPTGTQSLTVLALRRFLFGVLTLLTVAGLGWWLTAIIAADGFGVLDIFLLATFLMYAPWVVIGFWNSTVGFAVLHCLRNPNRSVIPMVERARPDDPVFVGVAILMTVRNEEAARAFLRLRTVKESIDATGFGNRFDYFVLSDSNRPDIIHDEEVEVRGWNRRFGDDGHLVYRRRDKNTGFKAGNVRDFLDRWGSQYDVMIPLDADSVMSGESIVRLVRIMQANPRLGILQSLVVGMPSPSLFARIFQFGMRHAMRTFTAGTCWWHGDCGPFWGHNAAVRIAPFREHCKLPDLPGKPPFGGHILSHDQIEAVLMRRAGFEVRVLPEEEESWEEMPPAMPDFAIRDLRWCQGNLQYLKLLHLPKLPMSQFNILFALQMFIGVAAFIVFVVLAAFAAMIWNPQVPFPAASALGLYISWVIMTFWPKILGVLDAALRSARRYGGLPRLLGGAFVETIFTFFLSSISMVGQTIFMTALLFGKTISWDGQRRDRYRLSWGEAAKVFWPHTLFAVALLATLAAGKPDAIIWFMPFLIGPLLSIPFAVFTALPELGAVAARWRFCAIPEEFEMPRDLAKIMPC